MAENTLIEVLRGEKTPMQVPLKALLLDENNRLAKAFRAAFTINDPNLREKLTAEEYRDLCAKYDYLVAPELPPEPPLLEDVYIDPETGIKFDIPAVEVLPPEPQVTEPEPKSAPKRRGRKPKQKPITDAD